jgi:hypothetical protein
VSGRHQRGDSILIVAYMQYQGPSRSITHPLGAVYPYMNGRGLANLKPPLGIPVPLIAAPAARDDLLVIDHELRDLYRATTQLPDGRPRRGRPNLHDTASRRWIDTVGFPSIEMGRLPSLSELAMLRLGPAVSLHGSDKASRAAWSQLHGRDVRSKKETAAQKAHKQTLLAWARTNMADALEPAAVRRGRVAAWKIDFGRTWEGYSPAQLCRGSAVGTLPSSLPTRTIPAGAYLAWITGQHAVGRGAPFKWRFPAHFYLYLAMRELEGRAVNGNDGPISLELPQAVHTLYEQYANIRLAPVDIDATHAGDDDHEESERGAAPSPAEAADEAEQPVAGALHAPPPPQPIDRIEQRTPLAQVNFFKGILSDVANGDRPAYKDWDQLTVRSHPPPPSYLSLLPLPQ